MSLQRRFLVLILACLVPSILRAATLTVGAGQMYATIQAGINAASNGDTVMVYSGTYYENIDFNGKAITVVSKSGAEKTIIDGKGTPNTGTVNFQSGEQRTSVLQGFTVRNGGMQTYAGGSGGGVHVFKSAPLIFNNVITGNPCNNVLVNLGAPAILLNTISGGVKNTSGFCDYGGAGVLINVLQKVGTWAAVEIVGNTIQNNAGAYGGGIVLNTAEGTIVVDNTIRNNSGFSAGGLWMVNTTAITMTQNLIYGNTLLSNGGAASVPSGVVLAPVGSGVGPYTSLIVNNTIADSLSLKGNLSQYQLANNIIAGASATAPMQCDLSTTIVPPSFDHNLIYNSGGAAYGAGCPDQTGSYGNLSADPKFVSATTGNYQVLAGSAAIDTGNNSALFSVSMDLAGVNRVQNATAKSYAVVDMGAYEFIGANDPGHTNVALTPSEYFATANPMPVPPALSFTVTLSSAAGTPYGPVAVYEDGTLLQTVMVGMSGTATFTPSNLVGGTHSFTAVYPAPQSGIINGPAYLTPAVSPRLYLLIPQSTSSVQLTSSPNPSSYGTSVTFTSTVSAGVSQVTLTDTSTNTVLTTQTPNAQGVATFTTSALLPGTHVVTSSFGGSGTIAAASASVSQVVGPVATSVLLTLSGARGGVYYSSGPITATAVIGGSAPITPGPSGVVTFYVDGSAIAIPPVASGSAAATIPALTAGSHTIYCVYSGDASYSSSTCAPVTINVIMTPTQTIVFPQPVSPAYAATAVALNAVASSGLPVTYTVVSGPATISGVTGNTLTYLGPGTVVIQADQAGDGVYPAAAPVRNTVVVTLLTEPLTTTTAPVTTLVTFLSAGTLANITVSTQGALGLDFGPAAGGTCVVGTTYTAGQTCTANFTFRPLHPGLRYGGIALSNANGGLLANSYILGLGTGPQVLYNPANQTTLGTGFGGLSGIAVDGYGNIYASDYNGGGVYEVSATTGATRLLATAQQATDIAVDGSGNVFYSTRTDVGEVLAVNGSIPASPTVRVLTTALNAINGMKVDGSGNVFVASADAGGGNSAITELLAVNGSVPINPAMRVLVANVGTPTGVAIDLVGNVYFSDQNGHSVHELVAVDGAIPAVPVQRIVSTAFVAPTNCFFDVSGNLYVPDGYAPDVKKLLAVNLLLPANPVIVSLGAGLGVPSGGTVDAGGSLFIADIDLSYVVKLAYGSAPNLTFASTPVNKTSSDSPQTITITNGGNADLIISPPVTGTNASITTNFSIGAGSTCPLLTPGAAAATLSAGASCTTAVSFTPTRVGLITGQLVRTDNNQSIPGSTQTSLLNGTGLALAPVIVFTVGNHTFGDAPFAVAATSSSAGAFTYSVVGGAATIAGNVVTLTGAGSVTLRASQAADGIYAAGSADATFAVAKKQQTITFPQPVTPVAFNTPITLTATASSGLPVVYSVVSGAARIVGNVVTPTAAGTLVIAADQPGDTNFAAAPQVTRTIVVNFGLASVTISATPIPVFFSNPLTLSSTVNGAGGTATGTVQYREGATVIGTGTIVNGGASFKTASLSVGSHTIVAYYSGDTNFAAANSASILVVVQDFSVTITNPNLTIKHGGTAVYNVVVTSIGGVGLASTINLTYGGGPDYSESTLTPATITSGSGTTQATLTMHTPNYPTGPFVLAGLFALALLPVKRARRWLAVLLMMVALGAVTGCGSGWKSQKWDVTVTATSGALVRTAKATLVSTP